MEISIPGMEANEDIIPAVNERRYFVFAARAIFAFAALALTAPPAARAQPLETMIDLGDLGGTASVAYGVSGDGLLVVGPARSEDRP